MTKNEKAFALDFVSLQEDGTLDEKMLYKLLDEYNITEERFRELHQSRSLYHPNKKAKINRCN